MEEDMRRIVTSRNTAKWLDAMISLPLGRFRRTLSELTAEELSALEARIAVHSVKSRWARGGNGIARHRSSLELGLLARREERDAARARDAAWDHRAAPPCRTAPTVRELATEDPEERGLIALLNRERSRRNSPLPCAALGNLAKSMRRRLRSQFRGSFHRAPWS